jgi:hypothetical protein
MGAEMLGLQGEVLPDQFEALRRNERPDFASVRFF